MNSCGIDNPCYKCGDRGIGCHDCCPAYRRFQEENEALKKRIRREAERENYARRDYK